MALAAPTPEPLASIRILSAVFREPINQNGAGHNLSRDICPKTLDVLSGGNFQKLSANVLEFANDLAKRRLADQEVCNGEL